MTAMARVEVLRAACCIAGADGEVDEAELGMLKQLAEKVGVGKASLDAMILRAESEPDFYQEQFRVLKTDPEASMKLLFQVAIEDRELNANEYELLKRFAARLGLDKDAWQELKQAVKRKLRGE